ncbi:cytochrome P450 2C14 isoform X2 [Bombina bombina]|uniref:cytochrome P450 2C14 isoform X2 n=1 Tax=Bombina bombina TaxID=8345 RepID=UPI00235A9FE4|nr:cytochrome P450 2C14 isoform X2 [Bombina bombina]
MGILQELLLVFVGCILFFRYLKMRWAARSLPPGPSPLPVIGNLLSLKFKLHPETLKQLAKEYGNIYTIWMGHTPLIVLNGLKAVKDALVSHSEELSGRPEASFLRDITSGKGIVASNGHNWKQQRRFGLMTLRNLGLGKHGLESRIQEEAQYLTESFTIMNGKAMDPSNLITHSVSNVISNTVFGHRFSIDDMTFQKLVEGNHYLTKILGSAWGRMYDAFPWIMSHVPGPHQKSFENKEYIENFVKDEIRIHQENGIPEEPNDLIDHYLVQMEKTKNESNSTYDMSNLIQVVVDLFTAGTESTATTLQWGLLFMLAYPDIQVKIQNELDAVLEGSQTVCYEDRKKLPYTNAVIHEIQRYGNIASVGIARLSIRHVTLDGYSLDKNTIILPNLDSVLHDPKHWETPYKFNPNHFLDKDGNFVAPEAFLPFSADLWHIYYALDFGC